MPRRRAIHEWEVKIPCVLNQRVQAYDRKGAIEASIEQAPEHMRCMLRQRKRTEFVTIDRGPKE